MPESFELSSTTQKFLDIFDITNDVLVLKDGTVTLVMVISAMNFGLLAEQEQDAIMYAYAALLNSLNFPIQIIISSKTKDATSYLRLLDTQAEKASSSEKRALIKRYQIFVSQLIKERNVLDKKFYVAIPASPSEVGMITPQSVLPGNTVPVLTREQKAAVIEKGLGVLEPRRDHLIAQFNRIGLYARQIATQEIIEIFYNSYNPEAYEGQQITESQDYTTMTVQAQMGNSPTDLSSLTTQGASQNQTLNEIKQESLQEQDSAQLSQSAVVPANINDVVDSMTAVPAEGNGAGVAQAPISQAPPSQTSAPAAPSLPKTPTVTQVFEAPAPDTSVPMNTAPSQKPPEPLLSPAAVPKTPEPPLPPVAEL